MFAGGVWPDGQYLMMIWRAGPYSSLRSPAPQAAPGRRLRTSTWPVLAAGTAKPAINCRERSRSFRDPRFADWRILNREKSPIGRDQIFSIGDPKSCAMSDIIHVSYIQFTPTITPTSDGRVSRVLTVGVRRYKTEIRRHIAASPLCRAYSPTSLRTRAHK